jgi:hypothetical protein
VLELQHEHRYLDLAGSYTGPPEAQLIITHGLSGSGKTTITQTLLEKLGAVRLRSDIERRRLFGTPESTGPGLKPGQGMYTDNGIRRTYRRLADLTGSALAAGFPVIVDATFLHAYQRDMFRHIAARVGYRFIILDCRAPQAQLRERIKERLQRNQDASEAGLEVLDQQILSREPLSDTEQGHTLIVDNAAGTDQDAVTRILPELAGT